MDESIGARTRIPAAKLIGVLLLFTVLASVCLAGCTSRTASCQSKIDALNTIVGRNPHADVQRAIASHDFRFIGVYGFSVDVPGVDGDRGLIKDHGVRMIDATTDAPCDEEHGRLIKAVRQYAKAYNEELMQAGSQR